MNSRSSDLSLNWVIRFSWPKLVTPPSSQAASAWAGTWLCAKTVERSGSSPVANSIAARSSVFSRKSCGSYSTLIECRSTMQKNPSPRSCVAAYWRKPPIRLPSVLVARGLDAGKDAHLCSICTRFLAQGARLPMLTLARWLPSAPPSS